ncbi:MAG: hypothetical protein JWQ50_824, partial [Caballeronia mineralivorans]|nr:hypothetical protein [Caballeronia mineralivorans]
VGDRRVGQRPERIGAGVDDRRVGDQRRVAADGGDGQVLRLAGAGGDARQVDGLRRGRVLEDRCGIGDRVERWRLVDRGDGDGEGLGGLVDAAVGGAAVVHHRDGDHGRAAGVGGRGEDQRARAAGVAVRDRGVGDQRRVAAHGRHVAQPSPAVVFSRPRGPAAMRPSRRERS